ncbi:MAG: hypothetical protein ABIO16_07350 [Nocardioides sp.]
MTFSQGRVAAVCAALVGVFLFWTVAAVDVPHGASDATLLAWWQDTGNRWSGVWSGLSAIGVAVTVAVVRHHLGRLDAARDSAWMALGRSMATAVTAVWLVTGAVRASVGRLVDVSDEPLPGVDTLRAVTAVNYALLGLSGMAVLGLMILGFSVAGLRTGVLPRWLAWWGVTTAVLMSAATLAQYGAYLTLLAIVWSLGLAVVLWRQAGQSVSSATVAPDAATSAAESTVNATP